MLKLIGTAMIILSGALFGETLRKSCFLKIDIHAKLLEMYNEIAILLEYSYLTYSEIINILRTSGRYNELDFLDIPQNSMDAKSCVLNNLERWCKLDEQASKQNLESFFSTLGTTDIQGQVLFSRLAAEREKEIYIATRKKYLQQAKLSRILGCLSGVLIAIMII